MKNTSSRYSIKLISAFFLVTILATNTPAADDISLAEQQFLLKQPNATLISPGVYSLMSGDSEKTYAFGTEGMVYTITQLDEIIANYSSEMSKEQLNEIELARATLENAYYRETSEKQSANKSIAEFESTDSGTLCGNDISYTISAKTILRTFFVLEAAATAGFAQQGAGPFDPTDMTTLYTFARGTLGGSTLSLESDLKTFSTNGLQFVSADPSNATTSIPSGQCKEVEAMAYIFNQNCAGFESVSSNFDLDCN